MSIELKEYHAPVWNEPVIMEMGYPGRRGVLFPQIEAAMQDRIGEFRPRCAGRTSPRCLECRSPKSSTIICGSLSRR